MLGDTRRDPACRERGTRRTPLSRSPHNHCGELATAANEPDAADEPASSSIPAEPPGVFVSCELAERCAEFLDEVKKTILRRQQRGLLHLSGRDGQ
jgi:hypothetical protein